MRPPYTKLTSRYAISKNIWLDQLVLPAYLSALSAASLAVCSVISRRPRRSPTGQDNIEPRYEDAGHEVSLSLNADFKTHVEALGGSTIFAYKASRLLGCIVLAALTLVTLLLKKEFSTNGLWSIAQESQQVILYSLSSGNVEWTQLVLFLTYVCPPAFPPMLIPSHSALNRFI